MRLLDAHSAVYLLAKTLKKPVLYLSFPDNFEDVAEIYKAVPFLDPADHETSQAIADGEAIIICSTEDERDDLFAQVVGDEGPTKLNPYSGPCRVYALTISSNGELCNENT